MKASMPFPVKNACICWMSTLRALFACNQSVSLFMIWECEIITTAPTVVITTVCTVLARTWVSKGTQWVDLSLNDMGIFS